MKDTVAIIGGGTAGLIAAKRLARMGIKTTVFDQKKVLGVPVRASGILSIDGLETLGIDYFRSITNTLSGADLHAGGEVMRVRAHRPMAYVLDRRKLNEICREEAEDAGARIELGRQIAGAEMQKLSRSNIIIGADGAISAVARHFSMGAIGRYITTYKAEYASRAAEPGIASLFFDNKIAPGLFGWLCPNTRDILEVGIGIDSRHGNAKAAFDSFIGIDAVKDAIGAGQMLNGYASIIPSMLRERIVDPVREVLLVGDAAGQVKPTTGGGIIFGGNAARIAAFCINEHLIGGSSLKTYLDGFMDEYGLELRLHSAINGFYSSAWGRTLGGILAISNPIGIDRFLGRYGDMDRPSLIMKRFFLGSLAG